MADLARRVVPDLHHPNMQRGNRRETVFFNEDDYLAYINMIKISGNVIATICKKLTIHNQAVSLNEKTALLSVLKSLRLRHWTIENEV